MHSLSIRVILVSFQELIFLGASDITPLSRHDKRFLKELAILELSRHALSLYMHANKTIGWPLEFKDIGFRVNFADEMAPKLSVIPFPFDGLELDDSSSSSSHKDVVKKLYRRQLSNSIRDGECFIEITIPTNRQEPEILMFLDEVKPLPVSKVVERPGQSKKITEALRTGISAGRQRREALHYEKYKGEVDGKAVKLDACYDEIDELRHRVALEYARLMKPEFDEGIIAAVVDQYLLEVNDSTPVRFS